MTKGRGRLTITQVASNQHTNPVFQKPIKNQIWDSSFLKPENWDEQRPCWYCGVQFKPKNRSGWTAHFCQEDHRKAFNKYGFMPYEKLLLALTNRIDHKIEELKREMKEAGVCVK